jgi:hypothetical protein
MCTFTVKRTNGVPTRAKSQIVVLGNHDPRPWTKSDCFSPVVSIPMVRFLASMAVHNKRTLKQGNCKFAFIQATLPDYKLTMVKPPLGCPFSGPRSYWKLKKSLYGLRHAPRHWYKLILEILQSPEISLNPPNMTRVSSMVQSSLGNLPYILPYMWTILSSSVSTMTWNNTSKMPCPRNLK